MALRDILAWFTRPGDEWEQMQAADEYAIRVAAAYDRHSATTIAALLKEMDAAESDLAA